MNRMILKALSLAAFAALAATTDARTSEIPFSDSRWSFTGDDTRVERFVGRESLRMRTGRAVLRDVSFGDGTIEFDMSVTPYRSFTSVQFRMQNEGEYERIYFRTHKSGAPDTIQYTPVYFGSSNWQLYHAQGYTAPAEIPGYRWVRVRLVLSGSRAAVFLGDEERPQLVVPRLARGDQPGYLALGSSLPQGRPQGIVAASFSNLRLRPGHVPYDFADAPEPPKTPPGLIDAWLTSSPMSLPGLQVPGLPHDLSFTKDWKVLRPDSTGLLVLGRWLNRPQGARFWGTMARVAIRSDSKQVKRLNLGFSDAVSVFLNGRLLISDDDSYSYNFPRRQGLIGLDQATVHLPLEEGDNELVVVVSDRFGGWGLMGQIEDRQGIEVRVR